MAKRKKRRVAPMSRSLTPPKGFGERVIELLDRLEDDENVGLQLIQLHQNPPKQSSFKGKWLNDEGETNEFIAHMTPFGFTLGIREKDGYCRILGG